ncbi:cytochrome bd-I ubiquinol oxidase subunit 1 apoprotein [Arboricoccus pini]|uniref:Cytochrome bd-I ubiquinol oxidase subunit 1 apoprotein n=1 Tax=Arboricoccus pini TaxID=1963835 RepID=A0A212R266_9PROT|nr:cytochrome bd-I ubiquinol oxidase subunit 1 apoprotein [Arboricoccus pini]
MDSLDAATLARIQFAFTVSFHILFPAFTIGLASYLAVLEGLWLTTKRAIYLELFEFWGKIFAVTFGMGVVSGIVLSYQFGTNWARFSDATGPVLGPLLGYEVLTAFFLEAGFIGIMLFGRKKVGPRLHFLATLLVAIGTLISAFWILSANSWMQTPVAFEIVNGQYRPLDWWAVIFNPSFPYRLVHMVLAAYLTTAFVVGATGAYHLLRRPGDESARIMLSMSMWMAAIVTPIQIIAGDLHGLNTLEYQPAKIAAMEGHFVPDDGPVPLLLFGLPDNEAATVRYAFGIPYLGSLILTHSLSGDFPSLSEFPREQWPDSRSLFWSFRLMVALGMLMLAIGVTSLWLRLKGRLYDTRWFLKVCLMAGPIGFPAILFGWYTTEHGRQPWLVYGEIRTADGISAVSTSAVLTTLIMFVVVYCLVFSVGAIYMIRMMAKGPGRLRDDPRGPQRSARPLSAAASLDATE